jgi:hypothetical protein
MLISTLVSLAVSNIACSSAAEVLPFITSNEQLSRVKIPDPSATSRAFTRALRSEEAYVKMIGCLTRGSVRRTMP